MVKRGRVETTVWDWSWGLVFWSLGLIINMVKRDRVETTELN